MYSVIRLQFDPFTAYPADELQYLTVALPEEIVAEIDNALEALPLVGNREYFIAYAVLFVLSSIHEEDGLGWTS